MIYIKTGLNRTNTVNPKMAGLECVVCGFLKLEEEYPTAFEAPMRNKEDLKTCRTCRGMQSRNKCRALEEVIRMKQEQGKTEEAENEKKEAESKGGRITAQTKKDPLKWFMREAREDYGKESDIVQALKRVELDRKKRAEKKGMEKETGECKK